MVLVSILTVLFLISWVGYSKYQFQERDLTDIAITEKAIANKKWHSFKFLNQVVFFALIAFYSTIESAIVLAVGYQFTFNSFLNVFALKQPIYHLGDSSIDGWMKRTFGEKTAYFFLMILFAALITVRILYPNLLNFLQLKKINF